MEVVLIEETKEMEASTAFVAAEDDGSSIVVKKKRSRRVSFAQTQTVHFIPRNEDIETPPLDSDALSKIPTPPPPTARSAMARVSAAEPDLRADLNENTADFSQFSCDMDTGHGSWADEDTTTRRHSLDGMEDDSGCFVHLQHISRIEDEDSIVNDVLNDDITMDATTFTKNLSQFLKLGTTFDSQGTGLLGKISSQKAFNDSDSRTEDDSMALTKPGAPHWALLDPNAVSVHTDDDQSDMSLATRTDKVRWKERGNTLPEKICSRILSSTAEECLSPGEASDARSIQPLAEQKENLPPQKLRDGLPFKAQTWTRDPYCDSDISMSLSNTMDVSLYQALPKRSDPLVDMDGNSRTPPMSRGRSGNLMQDTTFSESDFNSTVPVCNLKDLLSDHTDFTITRNNVRQADLSTGKVSDFGTSGANDFKPLSCPKRDRSDCPSYDHGGPCFSSRSVEVAVENKTETSSGNADQARLIKGAMDQNFTELKSVANREATPEGDATAQSSCNFTPVVAGSHQNRRNIRSNGQKKRKQIYGVQEQVTAATRSNSVLQTKSISYLSISGMNSTIVVAEQHNAQARGVLTNISDKEPMSAKSRGLTKGQQLLKDGLQQHANYNHVKVDDRVAPSTEIRKLASNKATESDGKMGVCVRHPPTKGPVSLDDILQRLEGERLIGEIEDREEGMVPLLPSKLETLSDYLHFSCSVQPQTDWLSEHVQELAEKLKAAKKRNAEIRSSILLAQKLTEEPTYIFKSKFEKKHSSARKEWILWKINPERQNLERLEESQDNLIREVEEAHEKSQQVLQLKQLYSWNLSKGGSSEPRPDLVQETTIPSTTGKEAQLLASHQEKKQLEKKSFSQRVKLERCQHHHQDASELLRVSKATWNAIQSKIENIVSLHSEKLQLAPDISEASFIKKLEDLIQKSFFTNSLLQQQQVMHINLKRNEGKSQTQFSLEGMYDQSFQYEGDGPLDQVKVSRSLHPEAIEMAFPCINASLVFQYLVSDLQSITTVQIQHIHQLIQRTNWLFGSLMDLLKEIKYCRRNFGMSSKFQIRNDKLLLCLALLQCTPELKVTLIFDMACIRGGRYPSDLRPAEVQIRNYGRPSNSSITQRDVNARIAKIEPGFGRLHRICSCVEKLMKAVKEK